MTRIHRTTATPKPAIPQAARRRLAELAGAFPGCQREPIHCAYCGKQAGHAFWPMLHSKGRPGMWVSFGNQRNVDIDHIVPRMHGGPTTLTNLALACSNCNRSKGHKHLCEWRGIA